MAARVNNGQLLLPPGFRFHPNDDELVAHYLLPKCTATPPPAPIIAELDLYKYDPWQLPEKALYGEKEWYFFSPRDRKYPNGSRPNRAAGNGYWKATGADKPIGSPRPVAIKKALVFYSGKAPNGVKTNWIMHEYRLAGVDRSARKKNSTLRLDDWVLCRIYHKKGALGKQTNPDRKPPSGGSRRAKPAPAASPEPKPEVISPPQLSPSGSPRSTEYICFGGSSMETRPKWNGESSSDEMEAWPELTSDGLEVEVESQPRWEDKRQRPNGSNLNEDVAFGFEFELGLGLVPLSPLFDSLDNIVFHIDSEMDDISQILKLYSSI